MPWAVFAEATGEARPTTATAPATSTSPAATQPAGACDAFGVRELYPTRAAGREWVAKWDNQHARTFSNAIDPDDAWFDTDHGDGRYTIDGQGTLRADGSTVRMYVHDPKRQVEWGENLEITVYITRISESKALSWSGLQIFARTNHGTVGDETKNIGDDRGYGAKVTVDGRWEFEKETAHHLSNGYASVATSQPSRELPKGVKVGVKYVLRNLAKDSQVKVELYRDLTGGRNGGTWEKMTEFIDTGANWGVGAGAAAAGVKPELPLIRAVILPTSESGKPMLTVYFRHEFGVIDYEKASIREIDPLP
jgi:hypothetical protein